MVAKLTRIALIVLLGATLGLAWNSLSGRGIALEKNVFVRAEAEFVDAATAKQRLERGALVLDARPVEFYRMAHIPGSLPFPETDFDAAFARLEPRLRTSFDIIIYCAGYGCESSHIVAAKLRERGIQAAILQEGWPAWTEAGYPTKQGDEP
jgi:rhodanese-related sulfurtransferase